MSLFVKVEIITIGLRCADNWRAKHHYHGVLAPMIELPEGYYRDNFIELLNYVHQQYADLLDVKALSFYQRFHQCDEDSQKLLVRMMTRKGHLFRASKLQYQEIADTQSSARQLAQNNLITVAPELEINDVLPLFNKSQWLSILAELKVDCKGLKSLGRSALDERIVALAHGLPWLENLADELYQLLEPECFDVYKLLFFGNLEQDLTEFVLRDLGLYRFENYSIDKGARLFSTQQQISQYLDYYCLIADLNNVVAGTKEAILALHQALPTPLNDDLTLNRRVQRVNLTLARQLERLGENDDALAIYRCCELPPSRERQARILVKQEKIEQALKMCKTIADEPLGDEEAAFAVDFAARTAKKYKIDRPPVKKYQPVSDTLVLNQSGQGVEVDVSAYLNQNGQCFYVENGLFCSVFALHYWQVIFAPVRGAFTNPFQIRPHDLYDPQFLAQRQDTFEQAQQQLAQLSANDVDYYIDMWREKFGTASPFVYWDLLSEPLLKLAFERIAPDHWRAIFKRIWADVRANRSGFADLIYFPADGGYELVEVKGPGDKLQKNQQRWMAYFAEHDIPHRVINVQWFTAPFVK